MSTLETNLVQPSTGTTLTLGASGDTVDVPSGATLDVTGATVSGLTTGKILQVTTNSHATRFVTSSTSFVAATGYTVAITPSATSSKIFIIHSSQGDNEASGRIMYATFYRTISGGSATHIGGDAEGIAQVYSDSGRAQAPLTISMLDSPSTTSEVTYQVYIRTQSGGSGGQVSLNNNEGAGHFTAFEVSG